MAHNRAASSACTWQRRTAIRNQHTCGRQAQAKGMAPPPPPPVQAAAAAGSVGLIAPAYVSQHARRPLARRTNWPATSRARLMLQARAALKQPCLGDRVYNASVRGALAAVGPHQLLLPWRAAAVHSGSIGHCTDAPCRRCCSGLCPTAARCRCVHTITVQQR